MSWKDSLQPASFRGVPFKVLSSDGTFGRNTALHVFPKRDTNFVEDLGRKARTFRIEAFLIGRDYDLQRNALINALEQPGPAKLVHPTLGELRVSLDNSGVNIREDLVTEGGMARVNFSVVESGEAVFPSIRQATQDAVAKKADDGRATAVSSFAARFNVDGMPEFAQNLSIARVNDFLGIAASVLGSYGDGLSRGSIFAAIGLLSPNVQAMVRTPFELATQVANIITLLRGVLSDQDAASRLSALSGVASASTSWAALTSTRQRDDVNRDAWNDLVDSSVAIERAFTLSQTDFTDFDSARDLRDQVTDAIGVVLDRTPDDALYSSLADLRSGVVQDVAARGTDLAHMGSFIPDAVQPALVIAYRLYDDAERDRDLVAFNPVIQHPGFVPAGAALQVVIDA